MHEILGTLQRMTSSPISMCGARVPLATLGREPRGAHRTDKSRLRMEALRMLNKSNFLVTEFVSKEESRYMLQAIRVGPEATVASNGHYLAWISTNGMKPESFPVVEGFDGGQSDFKPFLLDVATAKAIVKALPKKATIPVLGYAAVHTTMIQATGSDQTTSETDKVKEVQICVTDLERPQVFRPHIPEGQFPNYEAVIPDWEKDVALEIAVDPTYLATIAKIAAQFQAGKLQPTLRMKLYKQDVKEASESFDGKRHVYDQAVRFDCSNDNGQGMTVVLMPMRDKGDIPGTYGYKEREAKRQAERQREAKEAKRDKEQSA